MARPSKEFAADYFSHDSDMRNNRKIRALINKFGITGYALWCVLLEILTSENYNRINIGDEIEFELRLPDFLQVPEDTIREFIEFSHKIKLLNTEQENGNTYYFSEGLRDRLSVFYLKRQRSKERYNEVVNGSKNNSLGVSATETGVSATETGVSATETTQRKGKEIKGNESKVNKSKVNKREEGEESPSPPILKNDKKIETQDLLSKLAGEEAYFASLCKSKKSDAETIKKLFSYFQCEQTEAGKQHKDLADAKKHFSSWFDLTLADHAKFIAKTSHRANLAAKTGKKQIEQAQLVDVSEKSRELMETIDMRIGFLVRKSYPAIEQINQEMSGIQGQIEELQKLLPELGNKKLESGVERAIKALETISANPSKYLKSVVSVTETIVSAAEIHRNGNGEHKNGSSKNGELIGSVIEKHYGKA